MTPTINTVIRRTCYVSAVSWVFSPKFPTSTMWLFLYPKPSTISLNSNTRVCEFAALKYRKHSMMLQGFRWWWSWINRNLKQNALSCKHDKTPKNVPFKIKYQLNSAGMQCETSSFELSRSCIFCLLGNQKMFLSQRSIFPCALVRVFWSIKRLTLLFPFRLNHQGKPKAVVYACL